jgi:cytochrome c biogenesis protein CcdA
MKRILSIITIFLGGLYFYFEAWGEPRGWPGIAQYLLPLGVVAFLSRRLVSDKPAIEKDAADLTESEKRTLSVIKKLSWVVAPMIVFIVFLGLFAIWIPDLFESNRRAIITAALVAFLAFTLIGVVLGATYRNILFKNEEPIP